HTRFDCDWSSDVCSSDLTVQLTVRSLTSWIDSLTRGNMSRPRSSGSTSSMILGATGPVSVIVAAWISPRCRIRSPYHGGTYSRLSGEAYSARSRLTWTSKAETSTNFAP